jgi:hypothetical protein
MLLDRPSERGAALATAIREFDPSRKEHLGGAESSRGTRMKPIRANILPPPSSTRGNDLKSMSVDELWKLHEEVTVELAQKLESEKTGLQQRLRQFHGADKLRPDRPRRPSPR